MKRDDIYEEFQCFAPTPGQPDSPAEDIDEPYPYRKEWRDFVWGDVVRYRWILLVMGFLLAGLLVPPAQGLLAFITTTPLSLVGAIVIAYVVLTGVMEPGGSFLPDRPSRIKETPREPLSFDEVPFRRIEVERDRNRLAKAIRAAVLLLLLIVIATRDVFAGILLGPVVAGIAIRWALDRLL